MLFDATHAKSTPPLVRPLEEQDERESQRLWHKTVLAIQDRNHEVATDEKTKIEDMQRQEAAQRHEKGLEWQPKLFRKVRGGPGEPDEGEQDLDWILNADMLVFCDTKSAHELTEAEMVPHRKKNYSRFLPLRLY